MANKNLVLLLDFGVESFHIYFMIFFVSSTSVKKNQVILINFRSFVYWKAIPIFSIFFKMHLENKICQIELVFDFWVVFAAVAPPPVWIIYFLFGFLANKNLVLLFDFGVEFFHVNFMIFLVSSTSVKKNQVILINFRSFVYWKAISIFSIFFKMHLENKICQIELVFDFWVIFAAAVQKE